MDVSREVARIGPPCDTRQPLVTHVPGFRTELARLGYSESAAKKHGLLVAHLSRWSEAEGVDEYEVLATGADGFFRTRRQEGRSNLLTPQSLKPLMGYLRRVGALPELRPALVGGPIDLFLDSYRQYLQRERGLVEGTVRFYVHVARLLVSERLRADELDFASLTAADVTSFASRLCEHRGLSSAGQAVSALRSLLRFLRMEGAIELALDQAVLSIAGWNPSLPRAIDAGAVARVLESCDRRTAIECRDHAILMLLVRLGLRGGEVVTLKLGDVDWKRGEIVVRGKRRREERLPLPSDVGEALAGYLQTGRPHSESRQLFIGNYAPFSGLSAYTGAIRAVVARACERAGVPYASPHRLRHTAATEMLRAGAPLSEIAQVLRHRSSATTSIYAKVDYERLRELARPWPGVAG